MPGDGSLRSTLNKDLPYTLMDKIASNAALDASQLQKIAAYGFAVACSTPSAAMPPATVKAAAAQFEGNLKKAAARHASLVETLRGHLVAA